LTFLSKWIVIELAYIVLYLYLDIWCASFKFSNFWHESLIRHKLKHEISGLRLMNLTHLIKWVGLELAYIVLYSCLNMIRIWHVKMNYLSIYIRNLSSRQKSTLFMAHLYFINRQTGSRLLVLHILPPEIWDLFHHNLKCDHNFDGFREFSI
jgi:hypothetical protein